MKNIMLTALLCAFAANAALYKGMNEEGSVVYSDTPFENAEEINPPAITVVDAPAKVTKQDVIAEEKPVETSYSAFSIAVPADGETIWDAPDITVSLKLKPALDKSQGHTVRLLLDGEPLIENRQSLTLSIGRINRGEHTLGAQIVNKKGRVLRQTKSITVYIKNTFIQKKLEN